MFCAENSLGTVGRCHPCRLCSSMSSEILWANFFTLHSGKRGRDNNCNQGQPHLIPREITGRRHDPTLEKGIKSHRDSHSLFLKLFYVLIFRENGLSALLHSLLSSFSTEKAGHVPWAMSWIDILTGGWTPFFEGKSSYDFKSSHQHREIVSMYRREYAGEGLCP